MKMFTLIIIFNLDISSGKTPLSSPCPQIGQNLLKSCCGFPPPPGWNPDPSSPHLSNATPPLNVASPWMDRTCFSHHAQSWANNTASSPHPFNFFLSLSPCSIPASPKRRVRTRGEASEAPRVQNSRPSLPGASPALGRLWEWCLLEFALRASFAPS